MQQTSFYDDHKLDTKVEKSGRIVAFENNGVIVANDESSETARQIARAWASEPEKDIHHDPLFRVVDVSQIITQDTATTRDRIIEVFQRNADKGLCVYLSGLPDLVQMKGRTSHADLALEAIHDQLLRWDAGNLLIHDTDPDIGSSGLLAGQYRQYSIK